jgi:hypothetical protein
VSNDSWIHCPDAAKRERIAREMREFRASLLPEPKKRPNACNTWHKLLRINLSLNKPFPWVRWETPE